MPKINSPKSKPVTHSFNTTRVGFEFVDHFPKENEENAVHDITNALNHLGILSGTKY